MELKEFNENEKMDKCMNQSIDWLCRSPYCDRDRLVESQLNIVKAILDSYINGKKAFILEAPTGVGKSIIGILVAESIRRYKNYGAGSPCTYVLTSSKMLQDQMNRDKDNFQLNWTVLKGQGNYMCSQNGKPFTMRECIDMSVSKAEKDMPCAHNCGYIVDRRKAMNSDAAILSYAYWLTSMNFIYEFLGDYAPFQKRHVTIFDECHMLSEIVSNMFQTTISSSINNQLTLIHDLLLEINASSEEIDLSLNFITCILRDINILLINQTMTVDDMFTKLSTLRDTLLQYNKLLISCHNRYLSSESKEWSIAERRFDSKSEQYGTYATQLNYFIKENAEHIGYIVKTYSTDKVGKTTMTLRSLREQALLKEHVHKYTDFSLFMSATVGDADVFAENNGIENYDTMYIESNFDYSKSPIYNVGPPISMALKNKSQNMSELMHRIQYIAETLHTNERGIIHTGNFEISKNLREFVWNNSNNPHRYIFYTDANSKAEALKKLEKSKNGIIIGPSITEGLDLKDDLARFCILAKVPYPMLDEYNSKKMKIMPNWYGWKTVTSIMQAIGRPIRHRRDWAITYFMDSCFDLTFKYNRVPAYVTRRMKTLDVGNIAAGKLAAELETSGLFAYDGSVATVTEQPIIQESKPVFASSNVEYDDDLPF